MQGGHGKAVVMGMVERGGKVKAAVLGHSGPCPNWPDLRDYWRNECTRPHLRPGR
jgi:hypothetical protein